MADTTTPVKIDARVILESIQIGLTMVPPVAALMFGDESTIIAALIVSTVGAMISRILGKSATDAVAELKTVINQLVAGKSVLESNASPKVIEKADAAAAAIVAPAIVAAKPPEVVV